MIFDTIVEEFGDGVVDAIADIFLPTVYCQLTLSWCKHANTFPVFSLLSYSLAKQPIELKSFTN